MYLFKTANIKKRSYSWFSKECLNCLNKTGCISAGAFHQCMRHYFLHLKGYEYPPNEAMLKGKEFHKEFMKGIPTIDEYGIKNFLCDLPSEKMIVLQELPVCSPLYGLKGVIDKISLFYEKSSKTLKITVTELKSSFNRKYILQLASYGMILSDNECRIGYESKNGRAMQKLYPSDIKVSIKLILKIKDADEFSQIFMLRNVMTDWGKKLCAAINSKKKSYKHFHRAGIYFLSEIPRSKSCRLNCPYSEICDKIEFNSHKSKQRYFGKNKILIKTKKKIIG